MNTQTESPTRLHGRWLLIARVTWVALAILTLTIVVIALPARYDSLMLNRVHFTAKHSLEQLGLSVGFYAAYNLALDILRVLVSTVVALIIFWRKSDDWMVLFISLTLLFFGPFWISSYSFTVALVKFHPAWESAVEFLRALSLGCFILFFYLFPNGRLLFPWMRVLAVWILTWPFFPALRPYTWPSIDPLAVFLILFGLGVWTQIYRYARRSSSLERQQTKWAVFGLAIAISIPFAVYLLLTLNPSLGLPSRTGLVYSLVGDTMMMVSSLLVPLTISNSILRYRLWDIDIIMSRTLVYGALTASVVGLYVLIVGGLSIGLQTQNKLPGIVIAILAIAFLFQPLRRRLQGIADRLVPVPQPLPPSEQLEDKITIPKGEGSMLRHNRTALVILSIALLFLMLGDIFLLMRLTTPYDDARLQPGAQGIWHSNGVVISPLNQQPNGLHKGDLVVALNGRSLESFAQSLFDWSAPRPRWNRDQALIYTVARDGRILDISVRPGSYPLSAIFAEEWGAIVFRICFLLIAGFVFFQRPDESAARVLFLGAAGMASAITWSFGLQVSDIVGAVGWWLYFATAAVGYPLAFITMLHLALVFPQPRPIILRWRWLIPLVYLAPYTFLLATMIVSRVMAVSAVQWLPTAVSATGLIQLVCVILAIIINVRNYRSLRDPISRRQLRWVLFAAGVAGMTGIVFGVIPEFVTGHALLSWNVLALFALPVPLALVFAILRYRLFDIDVIINRTLVYGALTTIVIGIYVLVVGYLGVLFRTGNNLAISLLATGLVAVVFQPLRQRLQRGINRLMYGERDDPYAALSRLGRLLKASLAPQAVLPTVVTTVREVLKLPYVAIYLKQEGGNKIVAESASASLRSENGKIRVPGMEREGLCMPLIHQGETLGYIVLGPRAPNEAFSSTDLHLLDDLAPQVGVAVHAVRLTADLQRSRERLVLAREEERRRLRRDLHDDLGPTLASLGLAASTVADLIPTNPTAATKLVKELENQMRATVGNIRRLVYDLRPPTLDELGLIAAVRERATRYSNAPEGFHVTVDAPTELPALPAAVEVAAYRIVQEALENVLKHARARQCTIRFGNHSGLEIEITDDGIGLPANITPGVGLRSMRERAEELGGNCVIERCENGGTRILARLPIGEFDGTLAHPDRG